MSISLMVNICKSIDYCRVWKERERNNFPLFLSIFSKERYGKSACLVKQKGKIHDKIENSYNFAHVQFSRR